MNSIPQKTFSEIQKRLKEIEKEHNIKILLAIESGSRAWGFESQDSDFDIRFIYAQKTDFYLSIREGRDVIEYPIVDLIDINGWDIKKALGLFQKANPTFSEWIKSPIVYYEDTNFKNEILRLEEEYFSSRNYVYHYLHMAEGNYREYLKQDIVRVKKYFYVLRPILACLWIQKNGTPPPIEFDILFQDCKLISSELKLEIEKLLERKKSGDELDKENKIEVINDFIERQLENIRENINNCEIRKIPTGVLDEVFRRCL